MFVLSKNPDKHNCLLEIFPYNQLYKIQVLSCIILKIAKTWRNRFGCRSPGRCVVDQFHRRAHSVLQQAGDIVAVDATSSLDLQDTKLVRFVTCSTAGGIPLGYILVSNDNEGTLWAAFQEFHALLPECAFRSRGPDLVPVGFLTDNCR